MVTTPMENLSFAEGELASETPITCTLNNRYYDEKHPLFITTQTKFLD